MTDALARTTTFDYDQADRVIRQTLPDGTFIGFTYDANGNMTALTPPQRPVHEFTFTQVDLQQTYQPPAVAPGGPTQYAYNRDRQLVGVTRPDGATVSIGYDSDTPEIHSL